MRGLRNRHFLLSDIILLPMAVYASYLLRLEQIDPASRWWPGMMALMVLMVIATPLIFRRAGIYSRFWRYASIDEMLLLTGALTISVIVATGVCIGFGALLYAELWIPRSIPFILLLLGLVATTGPRLLVRIWTRRSNNGKAPANAKRVAIMGAGDAGTMIAREIQNNPQLGLHVVGFVDDNVDKQGMVIYGLPVLGGRNESGALGIQTRD